MGTMITKNSMEIPQKIKNRATIWARKPTSEYISKGNKITISKRYLHSHVHCSIIQSSHNIETILVSVNGWMDEENVILHTHTHTYTYTKM